MKFKRKFRNTLSHEHRPGTKLLVKQKVKDLYCNYHAIVLESRQRSGRTEHLVHYVGWNKRHDEWIPKDNILRVLSIPKISKITRNNVRNICENTFIANKFFHRKQIITRNVKTNNYSAKFITFENIKSNYRKHFKILSSKNVTNVSESSEKIENDLNNSDNILLSENVLNQDSTKISISLGTSLLNCDFRNSTLMTSSYGLRKTFLDYHCKSTENEYFDNSKKDNSNNTIEDDKNLVKHLNYNDPKIGVSKNVETSNNLPSIIYSNVYLPKIKEVCNIDVNNLNLVIDITKKDTFFNEMHELKMSTKNCFSNNFDKCSIKIIDKNNPILLEDRMEDYSIKNSVDNTITKLKTNYFKDSDNYKKISLNNFGNPCKILDSCSSDSNYSSDLSDKSICNQSANNYHTNMLTKNSRPEILNERLIFSDLQNLENMSSDERIEEVTSRISQLRKSYLKLSALLSSTTQRMTNKHKKSKISKNWHIKSNAFDDSVFSDHIITRSHYMRNIESNSLCTNYFNTTNHNQLDFNQSSSKSTSNGLSNKIIESDIKLSLRKRYRPMKYNDYHQ